jgi:hypothetical protein
VYRKQAISSGTELLNIGVKIFTKGTKMSLNPQEIAKVRKSSLHSVSLSSEMKTSIVDAKLRELNAEIKKVLAKKNASVEVLLLNFQIQ